ncbi:MULTISPECIES: ABC transporter ATP-binding protein [unclassified Porphyromonas]|uniref:ABC transporter ATP-binding protein n=1 Tax=unclassified Porphyromonas TaxID=2645799 RepID=UPI00052BC9A8|nr:MULTISPECIES: ATP-binding cassette domain-containing protein [unclassified Porphyromonas]KGN66929.1 phosphonate ABC transporter ATP-binding protein [Porphyromonas sp. COT-108 OH1349]KGN93859.1 phosphonate ABC transporter ATP-binding protein [Porphyromonas sp. COT-108 OH2963]
MIEIKNVQKSFGGKDVLRGISATFESGKTSLIIGKSGAGKTVLLKSIVGLVFPDKGEVLYDGNSIYNLSENEMKKLRQEVGMLFQGSALFDSMTILENVMFPLDMFSPLPKAQRISVAKECLARVKMVDAGKKYPAEVSGGMMKRAAIARAIALKPKYLFCDEPNSGLDPQTSSVIDDLLLEITHESGMTTIINTHDMNSLEKLGEKVIFVHRGRIEWEGRGKDIMNSNNERLKQFVFVNKE